MAKQTSENIVPWPNVRFVVAEAIEQIAAGKSPPQLIEIYNRLQPQHFAHWVHGLITAFVRVGEIDKRIIAVFIKDCLNEVQRKGFLNSVKDKDLEKFYRRKLNADMKGANNEN